MSPLTTMPPPMIAGGPAAPPRRSVLENRLPRFHEARRIPRPPVDQNLVVQMRGRAAPRAAHTTELLAKLDGLSPLSEQLRHVRIARPPTEAVIDLDHLTETASPADQGDHPRPRQHYGRLAPTADVQAGPPRAPLRHRADPPT